MTMVRDPFAKIMNLDQALLWRKEFSGTVVFTNGVFDLLHPGHVAVLHASRLEGDALIVALNSDSSVKRLKGSDRPIRTEQDRALVVAALECVDAVIVFEEDTPGRVINSLLPDVLVKGGDYSVDTIVGSGVVLEHGGRVVVVPLIEGKSTTSTIQQMKAKRVV